MALPEITRSTTVGTLNDVIKALKDAQGKTTKPEERERFNQLITKYSTSRDKLITICKNDIIKHNIFGDNATKLQVARLTRDNFKALSLNEWNALVTNIHSESELKVGDPGQKAIDFLEGKSGINLMTGVKATLATAAVAAFCSFKSAGLVNLFNKIGLDSLVTTLGSGESAVSLVQIIPNVISGLFAINPVIGVAAGVLMGIGVLKLTKKIFGPEIKKMWANVKTRHAVNEAFKNTKLENDSKEDLRSYMDGKTPEDYEKQMQNIIDHEDKKSNGTYENEFKDEALKLATGTGKDLDKEIDTLRKKFKNKLTPAEIDQYLRDTGLAPKQPDLGEIATDLKDDATFKKPKKDPSTGTTPPASKSRSDFEQFKKDYKKLVSNMGDPTIDATAKAKAIRDLRNYANDASKFVDGTDPADLDRQKKVQTICNGMVEILSDLYAEIAKDASKAAQKDAILRQLESDRGLAQDQFNKL